jgi:hypothetical protein
MISPREDYGMCAGKKMALLLSSALPLLLFSVAANAKVCVRLDYDNSAVATVSGRITTHHKLPKGSEGRMGDGPWLILDKPFLTTDESGDCQERRKIAILSANAGVLAVHSGITNANLDDYSQLRRLARQTRDYRGRIGSVWVCSGLASYLHQNYNHKKGLIEIRPDLNVPLLALLPPQQSNLGRHRACLFTHPCPSTS